MARFYLKTDDKTVTGPFTSLELREAALAHLVSPETGVAETADGPWTQAAEIGLFLDNNAPLPHPADKPLPEFRLTGVNEAFQGPLKLRELVDFAVRKILPREAMIQPVGRLDRIPVNHFRILDACLRGELSRNSRSLATRSGAPNAAAEPRVATNVNLLADPSDDLDLIVDDHREQSRKNAREKTAQRKNSKRTKPQLKIAYAGCALALFLLGILTWWITQPPANQTNRSGVIGSWVLIPNDKKGNAFGISFKDDGACVIFNSNGDCWSGDFQWADDATDQSVTPVNGKGTEVPTHHYRFTVQDSDGCVRLEGGASNNPPMFGDKPIRYCFLRQDAPYLWFGYPVNVGPIEGSQSHNVAWVSLWPRRQATTFGKIDKGMQGIDLLKRFGVPDEVRSLQPSEITSNSDPNSAEPRSLVSFGMTQLTLFADGSVRRFKAPKTSDSGP